MSCWQIDRGPGSVRLLAEAGLERGLRLEALLAGTGLSASCLDDPNAQVSAMQELRLIDRLLTLLGHPAELGWVLGKRYHHAVHGLWGYGLVSSATLAEALAHALEFLPLSFAFTEVRLEVDGDEARLCFAEPTLSDRLRCFVVERDMAAAAQMLHEVVGTAFRLSRVTRCRAPGASLPAESMLPAQPGQRHQLGGAENSLVFDAALLARPLPHANAITFAMCRQTCHRMMAERRSRTGLALWLADFLRLAPDGAPPGIAHVAALLGMGERTLKRRLRQEGQSYSTLLEASRRARAAELLAMPRLALADIAQRLGYSDASSFSQAFKRWHGVAPRTQRQRAPRPVVQVSAPSTDKLG
jgi:AraC-like DNA-binding protein